MWLDVVVISTLLLFVCGILPMVGYGFLRMVLSVRPMIQGVWARFRSLLVWRISLLQLMMLMALVGIGTLFTQVGEGKYSTGVRAIWFNADGSRVLVLKSYCRHHGGKRNDADAIQTISMLDAQDGRILGIVSRGVSSSRGVAVKLNRGRYCFVVPDFSTGTMAEFPVRDGVSYLLKQLVYTGKELKFSKSGNLMICFDRLGNAENKVIVWDLASKKKMLSLAFDMPFHWVGFSQDEKKLIVYKDKSIEIHRVDGDGENVVVPLQNLRGEVRDHTESPHTFNWFLSCNVFPDGTILIRHAEENHRYDFRGNEVPNAWSKMDYGNFCISDDGSMMVSCTHGLRAENLDFRDLSSGQIMNSVQVPEVNQTVVSGFSPMSSETDDPFDETVIVLTSDGKRLAFGRSDEPFVRMIDVATGKTLWVADPPESHRALVPWWWPTVLFVGWCGVAEILWRRSRRKVPGENVK